MFTCRNLRLTFHALFFAVFGSQVLATSQLQHSNWQQYAPSERAAPLPLFQKGEAFGASDTNGKAVQAMLRLVERSISDPTSDEDSASLYRKNDRWGKGKPGPKPVLDGEDSAPGGKVRTQCQYIVKEGDTLGAIAARVLGSPKRWEELTRANGLSSSSRLNSGQILKLPCAVIKAES